MREKRVKLIYSTFLMNQGSCQFKVNDVNECTYSLVFNKSQHVKQNE